ncbi:expressed unknown protein [Seminavis robusta]|uniref:UVR domain-containing protein n=1 Tax=Seminavis robusta TaxID=568900 RepID=A0A9N8HGP1_9STRA|nr:expressed unknown protein [Seminavis robusta]|eukprot:Sro588_g171540.1 n/a (1177) ;mRNA; r:35690-39220
MFGGLEIKGGDAKKEPKSAAPAPAPDAGSGFSFLNPAPAAPAPAPPAAAAAVGSGFSFLNATPAASEPAPAPPASSAFSFMQPATSAPAPADATTTAAEKPPEAPATETTSDAAGSGFSFLAGATPAPTEPPKTEESAAPESNVSSAFSFLSSTSTPAPEPPATGSLLDMTAPATTTTTPAKTNNAFAAAAPTTTNFAPPAGVGISFGGATVNSNRPKKKKNRAMKVGVGGGGAAVATTTSGLPAPSELPEPSAIPEIPASNSNTREDALEASRRAEEFMNQKMKEQATVVETTDATAKNPEAPAEYDDEMIAAAAAAAVEAQAMNQAKNQKATAGGARGLMGGLFRRASPPTSSSNLNAGGTSSKPGSFTSTGGGPRPPKPAVDVAKPSSAHSLSSDEGKPPRPTDTPAAPVYSAAEAATQPKPPPTAPTTFSAPPPLPPRPVQPQQQQKPEPPKIKTPQELLSNMLSVFRLNVETSMGKVTQLRQQRTRLLEERTRALTQERLATQQRDLTEQQLTAAAEAEDYELADQLGGVLSNYEKEQKECASMREHIDMAIQELDSQKQIVVQGVLQCFQTMQTQLETFESTQQTKEHQEDDTAMKKFASMTKHLAQEHERLQQDLKHLERDEELVTEERKEVETAISEQSCDFEKQRDEAKEKLAVADEELEELRRKLEAKNAEATQLRNEIAGHDDSILQVRVQFSRQLQRVQKKETTVKDHRTEWEAEKATFQAEKDNHEAEVKAHSDAIERHEKLMASLKDEIALAGKLEKIVEHEVGAEVSTSEEDGADDAVDSDILGLQAEVVKCEAAVTEAKEVLKVATTTLANLETEMAGLIAKIPDLEAVKKAAAAKRDFKVAGKASKEIKDATARVKECQEELTGEAVDRKETAEKELAKLEEELTAKRKVALEQEKETGVATMKKLAERIEKLVETKKQVCGDDYEPNRMQGVGAYVLEEQIKSLTLEGKSYGEKYGGWEELIAKVLPSEGGGDATATAESDKPVEEQPVQETDAATTGEPEKPKASKKEMKASFRRLTLELKEIEAKIEAAVADEDFDVAADLDEKLQQLLADVQALDLTDAEMEQALAGDDNDESDEPAVPTAASEVEAETDEAVADAEPSEEKQPPQEEMGKEDDEDKPSSGDDKVEATPAEEDDKEAEKDDTDLNDGFVAVSPDV